ncbi:aldo/keto reductase [Rubellicoccus peritrichatus]|uniref:Aldo/keto reductase n=1 Tax=Rubellicoccus peritrichatus TaxID=3080537 RepID=A0AAQ3QSP9_9BACT|nr:aldo/keto reductase [Puniceicoccus sp. CR14]WOO42758.1 aldo/keto reductase [Puniceicoccus sp. CR14]
MKYKKIGNTGVEVSRVGIGAWQIGGPEGKGASSVGHGWGNVSDDESIRLIHQAEEIGINLIDTADIYGDGHSESVIGEALQGRRENWIVATKGGLVSKQDEVGQYMDVSAAHIRKACEASLKRLKTEYIDFYQLHGPPEAEGAAETMGELAKLRDEGKIRFYGVSANSVKHIIIMQEHGPVDIIQLDANIFREEVSALYYALRQNIGTLVKSPLAWGATFGKYATQRPEFAEGDMRVRQNAADIQEHHAKGLRFSFLWEDTGRSPAQAVLRAVLDKPGVTAVIPGCRTVKHLIDNAGAADAPELSAVELRKVWKANMEMED